MVRSMMKLSDLPLSFRGYALETTAHILNMVSMKKVAKTLYKICHRKAPKLSYMRVWGCDVLVRRSTPNKLKTHAIKYTPTEPQTEEPFLSSIILRNSELVVEEANPTYVVVKAPPENQENNIAPAAHVLLRSSRPSQPERYYGFLIDSKAHDLGDHEEPETYHEAITGSKSGNDIPMIEGVKTWLKRCFAMKDLGEAAYILGIKIYKDISKRILGLSQSTYIENILKRFKSNNFTRGWVPITVKKYLSDAQSPTSLKEKIRMGKVPYPSAIRSIMYDMTCTRPDVSCVEHDKQILKGS
ncbi:retrotransposon protein, putative, ty1-copia subclass [Tanacetum coccineum]